MPSSIETDVLTAAAIPAGLLVVVLLAWWRSRRRLVRRLSSVAVRLDDARLDGGTLDATVAALERAAEGGALRVHDHGLAADRADAVLSALPQAVVVCDELGDVCYRNGPAEAMLGTGDGMPARVVAELLAAAMQGEARPPTRMLDVYGPPRRTFRLSASLLDDGRRALGAVVVAEDVSDRRRVEAIRRDFVDNVAHELRGPISTIGALGEALATEDDVRTARRLAVRVGDEAARLGRVVDDLLALSRIEGEFEPARDHVPVHLVLAEAAAHARVAAASAGVRIDTDDPPSRVNVVGDRRQLVSAVAHLLENAVRHSPAGGAVQLRCSVMPGADGRGPDVVVTVRDEGAGIPARDLERIFERFYKVDRSGSDGSGLGLAIVRHVAANHGGRVEVHSTEGKGSMFRLRVPAGPGAVALLRRTEEQTG